MRPTDRKHPKSVGFIQCVGSRSASKGGHYCSNICCMNTIKSTLVLKEHYPDMEVKVFYIDIRAFGKGFEDLYTRSRRLGVHYVRGLPGSVEETADGSLRVAVENTATGELEFHDLDMLVLAIGMEPAPGDPASFRKCWGCSSPPTASSWRPIPSCSRWTRPPAASSTPAAPKAPRTSRRASPRPRPRRCAPSG